MEEEHKEKDWERVTWSRWNLLLDLLPPGLLRLETGMQRKNQFKELEPAETHSSGIDRRTNRTHPEDGLRFNHSPQSQTDRRLVVLDVTIDHVGLRGF